MTTTQDEPVASSAEPMELLRGILEERYVVDTGRLTRMTVHAALPPGLGRDMRTLAVHSASVRLRIAETARALRRMSEGTYGRCEDCDKAIPLGRLRATPQAAQCAPCESRTEFGAADRRAS
ncbi:TraR/DksA family transcriptional regulator [Actinoplanes sp. NPDC049668]|uniref:TraR/DksA family transcriptional regulator n=1 Tax=unclassified Actinoplanes TaxID=2626549 RepID=UPI0033BCB47D